MIQANIKTSSINKVRSGTEGISLSILNRCDMRSCWSLGILSVAILLLTAAGISQDKTATRNVAQRLLTRFDSAARAGQSFIFSPDNKRIAFRTLERDKQVIVLDGKKSKPYDIINEPIFSADN